ncbi:uncharacterized protein GGS25DRAFT_472671 [Hypoxylon fragiforme]|uniref:uncharacterized protein n=1 Tax=Hypoxylon fragiforme TaxID=63214 RepID=UPI0020C662ED|nr:uncharacterized protein GGS25DRAFT_472671 [Hypoxylon fragiforme]KAI2614672.1 hypothetical protein GGS25DRAFT_472671 [Hypoxylon fragiforme]
MDPQQASTITASTPTFYQFTELPVEIQLYIWELVLGDSEYIRTEWSARVATIWPFVPIPQLQETDPAGLIPYTGWIQEELPATLASFPPPWGYPDPQASEYPDWHAYKERLFYLSQHTMSRARFNISNGNTYLSSTAANIVDKSDTQLACFSVCRTSRAQAMRHVIGDTEQFLQCKDVLDIDDQRMYPVPNGFVLGNVFKDQRGGRPCFAYVTAPHGSEPMRRPRFDHDFRPGKHTHVAARLSDIERCIFGRRLSLTKVTEGWNTDHLTMLREMMWWGPELGLKVRRPEANHPLHCPPFYIFWIYSMILHHLADTRAEEYPMSSECLTGDWNWIGFCAQWYNKLVRKGECRLCKRPLIRDLQTLFPESLDSDGCIDIVILRDRKSVELPDISIGRRSYEFGG